MTYQGGGLRALPPGYIYVRVARQCTTELNPCTVSPTLNSIPHKSSRGDALIILIFSCYTNTIIYVEIYGAYGLPFNNWQTHNSCNRLGRKLEDDLNMLEGSSVQWEKTKTNTTKPYKKSSNCLGVLPSIYLPWLKRVYWKKCKQKGTVTFFFLSFYTHFC